MSSGRRYNVQRHIENIHQGYSRVIPFTEYIVGRCDGSIAIPLYSSGARPSYGKKEKAGASNGDQLMCELIKATAQMVCARQSSAYTTYSSSTYHQPVGQQPADSDKMSPSNHDAILETAKIVEQRKSNNLNISAENPLNSLRTSTSQESDLKEIARKGLERYFAQMDKNDGSKNP